MNLKKLLFTSNDCYRAGKTIAPKGILVHSTGANNPNLRRYVGPDDGLLGENRYKNHWNRPGVDKCPHAVIGKLADGTIATYQTLPWNYRGWHAGGKANDTHIGFEICEDDLTDSKYFRAVYKEAVELCAYLCKELNIKPENILGHSEGYQKGIASNHADPAHWFSRHGKSMDTFRADVGAAMGAPAHKTEKKKSNQEIANEVIKGLWGNGAERKKRLAEAGYDYNEVQNIVNQKLAGTYKPPAGQPKSETKAPKKPAEMQKSENLYRVQVGAFENKAYAERLAEQLKKDGYPAYVVKSQEVSK